MSEEIWLHQELDSAKKFGVLEEYRENDIIEENLNQRFVLREYQKEAFARFIYYIEKYPEKKIPVHLLFHMATGSGKTLIMAGLILYLYTKGYRNFLFFVDKVNIIEKTKENFLNNLSKKYLFNEKIIINNNEIKINKVENFEGVNDEDINICFTSISKIHSDLKNDKENSLTFEYFKNKKIVLLSDESHHTQGSTKQNKLNEKNDKGNWENTVLKIFEQNKDNILLEFTATMDFTDKDIGKKYLSKVIFEYDLKHFRNDRFSKDIEILRTDTDKKSRILLALILNQYRQDIAAKYGIILKPVILFKAQNTIDQSLENKKLFHEIINNLSIKDIDEIRKKTDIKIIKKAFEFYERENIYNDMLIKKLKINFSENKCINMNNEEELEKNYNLINNLEENNNQLRVIFTVNKLNEGWDVLNLFDIVRLHEGQTGGGGYNGKISPATISEAQLIGRGARYYPFKTDDEDEKYLRKYDKNLEHDLRIIEELYFHSYNESRYIYELKKALEEQGLIDEKTVQKQIKLKDEFKKTTLYKEGVIYLNEKIENDFSDINSFNDIDIKSQDFIHEIKTYKGKKYNVFEKENEDLIIQKVSKTMKINEIEEHIIKNALAKKEFFKYENMKKYFDKIESINDLITEEEFLANISIEFKGNKNDIEKLSNTHKYNAVIDILDLIENKIKIKAVKSKGKREFNPVKINVVFHDKVIKVEKDTNREYGEEEYLKDKDWYAFNANYGTSEEKDCVKLIEKLINEKFNEEFNEIYLLRNELHFTLYNFDDGRGFSPDFVLFMKSKKGKNFIYQIFIEAKGPHLEEGEKWKEKFLKEIKIMYESDTLIKFIENTKYKIIGVPFYNKERENQFKNELLEVLK